MAEICTKNVSGASCIRIPEPAWIVIDSKAANRQDCRITAHNTARVSLIGQPSSGAWD